MEEKATGDSTDASKLTNKVGELSRPQRQCSAPPAWNAASGAGLLRCLVDALGLFQRRQLSQLDDDAVGVLEARCSLNLRFPVVHRSLLAFVILNGGCRSEGSRAVLRA
jgi:hypothetical protein